jgi:hypothetical protein
MLLVLYIALIAQYRISPQTLTPEAAYSAQYVSADQRAWLDALEKCESTGSTTVRVLDSNDRYSYGILQFQAATWLSYSAQFGTSMENIYDKDLQETVAFHVLDNGGWSNWYNCGRGIITRLGPWPSENDKRPAT